MKDKRTWIAVATIVFFLNSGARCDAFFGDMLGGKKEKEYQALLEEKERECKSATDQKDRLYQDALSQYKDAADSMEAMRSKNKTLMEAYEKLKTERESLMDQITRLRRKNQSCDEMKSSYDQVNEDSQSYLQEKEKLQQEKNALGAMLENLKSHIGVLTDEKDRINQQLIEAKEGEDVKVKKMRDKVKDEMEVLKSQVNSLKTENLSLVKQMEASKKEGRALEVSNAGLSKELGILRGDMEALRNDYAQINAENKLLSQEATQFPRKFADLARHNHKLFRETADMHYNLGVSHIKNKDYKRAVKEFERVVELKPEDAYANYNLGYIYAEHLVDREKAIDYFEKYLTYASDAKDADWVRKYILTWQTWYGKEKIR